MTQLPDLGQLAAQIAPMLTPFLPYLFKGVKKAGEKAFEKAGEKVTEGTWNVAERIWKKIHPVAEKKPASVETLVKASEQRDDPKSDAVITWTIQELLKELPAETIYELEQMVDQRTQMMNVATGNRSIAIGGDVHQSFINSGTISAENNDDLVKKE